MRRRIAGSRPTRNSFRCGTTLSAAIWNAWQGRDPLQSISGRDGDGARVLLLLGEQARDDLPHRHPGLVLPEVHRRARAEVEVLLLRLDHRHILQESLGDEAAHEI